MATFTSLNFVPTSISGCSLWLDGADSNTVLLSGGTVSQWNDKSGNGRNVSQTTPGYQGSFLQRAQNNLSVVSINSNQGGYSGPTLAVNGLTGMSIFTVVNNFTTLNPTISSGGSPYAVIYWPETGSWGQVYIQAFQSRMEWRFGSGQTFNNPYATFTPNVGSSYNLLMVSKAGLVEQAYQNGSLLSNYTATNSAIANTSSGFGIASQSPSANLPGLNTNNIGEILVYTTSLTTPQRQQIEGYLAWKWGLQGSLPSTHPYYNFAPNSQNLPYPSRIPVVIQPQAFLPTSNSIVYFNPRSISGCALWLDAADAGTLSLSGTAITQWRDKSSNAYQLNQATAGNRPTYSNGVVNCLSSSQQFLSNAAANVFGNTGTFFITMTSSSGDSSRPFAAANGSFFVLHDTTGVGYYNSSGGAYSTGSTFTNTLGTRSMRMVQRTGAPLGQYTVNGGAITTNTNSDGAITVAAGIAIGRGISPYGDTSYFTGSVCEVLGYTTYLSSNDVRTVEGYLAWKWGLASSLPSTHPYKNTVPGSVINIPIFPFALQPASFSPKNYSGLQLWLDASDLNGNGTNPPNNSVLSAWADKSSNSYSLIQPTASNQPTYTTPALNGLGGVQVTTTTWLYRAGSNITNFATGSNTSVFMVARNASTNTSWNIFHTFFFNSGGTATTNARYHFSFNSNTTPGLTLLLTNSTAKLYNASWVTPPLSNAIVGFTVSPSFTTLNWNGNTQTGTGVNFTNSADDTLFVFQDPRALPANSNCIIYEMVGYNTQLTTPQTQAIEGYLAWKWGLQGNLPATHPYKKFGPPPN